MISIFSKLWIKDYKNTSNPKVRRSYGVLCSFVGMGLNILLFVGKYYVGLISHSIAIIADAFNNLSDASSSFITLIGFKFAGIKADAKHPFGHGRLEYITGFIISLVILAMGVGLFKASYDKIRDPQPIDTSWLSIFVLMVSILVKLYMSFYHFNISKKIESLSLKATAIDSLSDAIATTMVLFSVFFMKFFSINIDGYCGIIVACFILYAAYQSIKETTTPLLGTKPNSKFVHQIEEIVLSHASIISIHDLVVHDYGLGRKMVSLHAEVLGNQDVFTIHEEIDHIEMELNEKLGCETIIHVDPIKNDNQEILETKENIEKMVKEINEGLTIHDFRMIQKDHPKLLFEVLVPYDFSIPLDEVETMILSKIQESYQDYQILIKIEQSYI